MSQQPQSVAWGNSNQPSGDPWKSQLQPSNAYLASRVLAEANYRAACFSVARARLAHQFAAIKERAAARALADSNARAARRSWQVPRR